MLSATPNSGRARTGSVLKFQKKHLLGALIFLVIAVAVVAAIVASGKDSTPKPKSSNQKAAVTGCGPYRKDGVVSINGKTISVETAAGQQELTKGLSGRPCIESNWGMLFDFGHDGQYAIWMKDMKFPIDVAWINSAHKVVALEIDFKPSTYPDKRVNQTPARYVLEMPANKSKELSIYIGTSVHFYKS
jgi:uncharacterized membrane protein (UPF0127 family)